MSFGSGLKTIWKVITVIREICLNIIFLLTIILIFGIYSLMDSSEGTKDYDPSGILVLDIEGSIVDSPSYDEDLYTLNKKINGNRVDSTRENSVFELTQKIEQATLSPKIEGIILKLDNFTGADLPTLEYVAKYLAEFKKAGKPIYAVGSQFDQKQYYLASTANKIYLLNQGTVSLYGFSANNLYFKSLLDNLKVDTHVFRVGTYKSAIEPFTRDNMSEAAKANTTRWLTAMWGNYLTDIASYREKPQDNLVPAPAIMLDRLRAVSGSMSDYALKNGIVDFVTTSSEFNQAINKRFGGYASKFSVYDYGLHPKRMQAIIHDDSVKSAKPLIAVVFIDGTIATGESTSSVAGSDTIVKQLKKLVNNKDVKAVVLRINSPGGGVYASEAIRSEVAVLRQNGVKVVVSMGGLAASGGYWIASESDYIVADKNTITGSIGIFGVISTFKNSLSHIGVHADGVSTSPLAGVSIVNDLPPEFNEMMQLNIENGYNNFITLVAKSREMTNEEVDKIAQGQVWLGQEAKEIGLVDELGDFDKAVVRAAKIANIPDHIVVWEKPETSFFNMLLGDYSSLLPKSAVEVIYNQLPISSQIKQHVAFWDSLNDPQNRYGYCLNCADIN